MSEQLGKISSGDLGAILSNQTELPAEAEESSSETIASEKIIDLLNDQYAVHGTFIENLESILVSGLGNKGGIRQYGGYDQPYFPSAGDFSYPWETKHGPGIFVTRVNFEHGYPLNYHFHDLPTFRHFRNSIETLGPKIEGRRKFD